MQAAVLRTGYSTIIRESHDFSAGITDHEGNVVGQFSPLPTHLGAYPDCVQGVLEFYDIADMHEGDCFLTNHPYYSGCPHPNDMVVVMPVFADGEVIAFCAEHGAPRWTLAASLQGHGTLWRATLFGEGLSVLPVKFMDRRTLHREVVQFLRANTRTPELVLGDLEAQAGALWSIGIRRLGRHGGDVSVKRAVLESFKGLGDRTETRARQIIASWPNQTVEAEAFIDDIANPTQTVRIHVSVEKKGSQLIVDFSGSGDQSIGPVNARPPFVRGMVSYAAIAMMGTTIPNNHGLIRAIECRFREGSVICPTFPAPVGFYSMTMPVVEDVVFEAFSKVSGRPAVAHNSVSGLTVIGSSGPTAKRYVQYEIIVSGNGAYDGGDGWTGTGHSWSGGAKYTGVEIIESEFDVDMQQFNLVADLRGSRANTEEDLRSAVSTECDQRRSTRAARPGRSSPRTGSMAVEAAGPDASLLNPGTENTQAFKGVVSNVALAPV